MDLNNQDLTFLSRLKPSRGSWGPISKLTGNSIFFNFFTIPNNMGVYGLPSTSATKIWPFWADLPHGEPDARGWSREAAELPSLHKRTSLLICQRILLVLHLLRYKVYLVHNFSSEDSSSGDDRQARDLDDKSKIEQTSCKLELTASQVKFMLEDSD